MQRLLTLCLFVLLAIAVAAVDQEKVGEGKSLESQQPGGLRKLKDKQKKNKKKKESKQKETQQKETQKNNQSNNNAQNNQKDQRDVTTVSSSQDLWLEAHNWRRSKFHTSYGRSPRQLQWSSSLARSATNYAESLTKLRGCDIEHNYNGDSYGGENLYCHWGTGSQPRVPETVLNRWWDREQNLAYGRNGHFTQAAWYATSQVGCGVAKKTFWENGSQQNCYIHVCRYLQPGNCNMSSKTWFENMLASSTPCTA